MWPIEELASNVTGATVTVYPKSGKKFTATIETFLAIFEVDESFPIAVIVKTKKTSKNKKGIRSLGLKTAVRPTKETKQILRQRAINS